MNNSNPRKPQQNGFTLIELMIVVAIIGIIMTIAFPSYQESVRASRRSDGMALISQILQAQERYYVNNYTYSTDLTAVGYASASNIDSEGEYYKVSATACGTGIGQCVLLTAVGQGDQANDGNLTLNSQGAKTGNWD